MILRKLIRGNLKGNGKTRYGLGGILRSGGSNEVNRGAGDKKGNDGVPQMPSVVALMT